MNIFEPKTLPASSRAATSSGAGANSALRFLWRSEPRLVGFALLMLALMLPAAIGLGLDERTLRGVSVWVKPMKFMLSVALLALTTAWFAAQLSEPVRRGRVVAALVWTLIASGSFEVGYITLQAALGEASHFNLADRFHRTMYTLMGVGAMVLTATQPWLAWLIWRQGDRSVAPAYRLAVLLGLTLTFVLGAGAGMLLSGVQPPSGAALAVLGWSRTGGDLRVAHFIGMHAGQVLPAIGFTLAARWPRVALPGVWVAAMLWTGLWAVTLAQALSGRPLIGI